jgi:hypothetical protein
VQILETLKYLFSLSSPLLSLSLHSHSPTNIHNSISAPGHPNLVKYFGWGKVSKEELLNEQKEIEREKRRGEREKRRGERERGKGGEGEKRKEREREKRGTRGEGERREEGRREIRIENTLCTK